MTKRKSFEETKAMADKLFATTTEKTAYLRGHIDACKGVWRTISGPIQSASVIVGGPDKREAQYFEKRGVCLAKENETGQKRASLWLLSDGTLAEMCSVGSEGAWTATLHPIDIAEALDRYDSLECVESLHAAMAAAQKREERQVAGLKQRTAG